MVVYMIRHNPTGLYYVSTAKASSYGSGLNIQKRAMVYTHKPTPRYFFAFGDKKTTIKNRVDGKMITAYIDDFEIVEFELQEKRKDDSLI